MILSKVREEARKSTLHFTTFASRVSASNIDKDIPREVVLEVFVLCATTGRQKTLKPEPVFF